MKSPPIWCCIIHRPPSTIRERGSIAVESTWQRDLEGENLSSVQPGVSMRLSVPDAFGGPGTLRIRHRTRLYHRSQPLNTEPDTDEWAHRLSEFGWYVDAGGVRDAIGFGRGAACATTTTPKTGTRRRP